MSLQTILSWTVPAITFFLMIIVGMDVTPDDFRKVRHTPKVFWIGIFGQYLLPVCSWILLLALQPVAAVASGMILISSAPAGGISTYYSSLARVNIALAIVLTSVSSVFASVTMPLFLRLFHFLLPQSELIFVPLRIVFSQLARLLLIPVLIGCLIRYYSPEFVARYSKILRLIGFFALGSLIIFIFYQTRQMLATNWLAITEAAILFILLSMALGYALGWLIRSGHRDSFTLTIEFGTRNTAITTATAMLLFQRTDFAAFAASYFLLEALLIIPIIWLYRHWTAKR